MRDGCFVQGAGRKRTKREEEQVLDFLVSLVFVVSMLWKDAVKQLNSYDGRGNADRVGC